MDPLAQLQDIHVPEAVSYWPLAWGWWALFAVAFTSITIALFYLKRFRQKRKIRSAAMLELAQLDSSAQDFSEQANALLKRACMGYFDKEIVSSLYGEKWRRFLVSMLPKGKQELFDAQFKILQMNLYQSNTVASSQSPSATKELVTDWLKHALPPKALNIRENV